MASSYYRVPDALSIIIISVVNFMSVAVVNLIGILQTVTQNRRLPPLTHCSIPPYRSPRVEWYGILYDLHADPLTALSNLLSLTLFTRYCDDGCRIKNEA